MLRLLLGGARSGKSALACSLAGHAGRPVTFVATATVTDAEFERRVALHRASRPSDWVTVEEPVDVEAALASVDASDTIVVDCLTLWVANLLEAGSGEEAVVSAATGLATAAEERPGLVLAVSNEVGSGIVPMNAAARHFRDVLGRANTAASLAASDAYLVVAGRLLRLEPPSACDAPLPR